MIYDAAGHYVGFHYNKWPLSSNILTRIILVKIMKDDDDEDNDYHDKEEEDIHGRV